MKTNSLIFAPLEGFTDPIFRVAIDKQYPEWDYYFTDFIRLPTEGYLTHKMLDSHLGTSIVSDELSAKTVLQVLCSLNSNLDDSLGTLSEREIPWLDLNAGCPSKKVNAHRGGAYLMSDPQSFRAIVQKLRKAQKGVLSVKIRSGFKDDAHFIEIINMLEGEGVDIVTVHPRTQTQMYMGFADWTYITEAARTLSIPVIGNGDIKSAASAKERLESSGCHSLMIGRGAIAAPWIAREFGGNPVDVNVELKKYLLHMRDTFLDHYGEEKRTLIRLKSIIHYTGLDDEIRRQFLRSRELQALPWELI